MTYMLIDAPNIFQPRNDWNIRTLQCRKPISRKDFVKDIATIIAAELEINPFVNTRYRERRHVQSRQLLLAMLYNHTAMTLSDIGEVLGKDHSTTLHAIKVINNMCETDKRFKALYDRINDKVKTLK